MNKGEKEDIKEILNNMKKEPKPNNNKNSSKGSQLYSKSYKNFLDEEENRQEDSKYEKFCKWSAGIFQISGGESTKEKIDPPLRLLGWELTPGMVISATIMTGVISLAAWSALMMANTILGGIIPFSLMIILLVIPIVATGYTYMLPVYKAKNKVIKSSGEIILSVLYMIVYLRKNPNLEGAVRFAALNLEGPISKDFKGILWQIQVGKVHSIEVALEDYKNRWRAYNEDLIESLNLIETSMEEKNPRRREELLQRSIDTILEGTQEKMKHYAQGLKTPVMILNAMGAMLPVLGMIMLPLVSIFMGGAITPLHLIIIFNILLPVTLYWFMQRILSSRPPTVASQPSNEDQLPPRGKYPFEIGENTYNLPVWPIGIAIFLIIGLPGLIGYFIYPTFFPIPEFDPANTPNIFISGDQPNAINMLMRSQLIILGLGLSIGITKVLGNTKRKAAEEEIQKIEQQFPNALFALGNKISGGTPSELALKEAADSTEGMEISGLFRTASDNIRRMGMTFEESIFNEKYGALKDYPSQMIETIMNAVLKSSEKGTKMASSAMLTISEYLDNIHKTQEHLNDLMEESTTTLQLLAYMLAPIVSGIAVGMSQTIITAIGSLSGATDGIEQDASGGESLPGAGDGPGGMDGILTNLDTVIPPELLQFVVGIYLIQLLYILGTFYMKIVEGENQTYKNMFIGKILISGITFYTITVVIISLLFSGMMTDI